MVCKTLGCRWLAMAAIMALAGSPVLAQEKQTPGASRPSTQETNSSSKSFEAHGLKELEQSLFRPFRSLEPETSLDGILESRPQRPPVSNKRTKEMMERRKNWAFMTPEEIVTGKSPDDSSDAQGLGKDQDDSKLLSPMDRYFQRLYGQDRPKNKDNQRGAKNDLFGSSGSKLDDAEDQEGSSAGLPESVRETQRNLKKSRGANGKEDLETRRSSSGFFADVFALERKKPTPEEEKTERERMEAYRKSL